MPHVPIFVWSVWHILHLLFGITSRMPTFVFNVQCDSDPVPFKTACSILGDGTGFSGGVRRFKDDEELRQACDQVGITGDRYEPAIRAAIGGELGHFDIDQNEAQKLGVLATDSTE